MLDHPNTVYDNSKVSLNEVAVTNQTTSGVDQDSMGGSAGFIHTSTLHRIPTNVPGKDVKDG